MTDADLAYVAAVLDAFGRISTRALPNGTDLPEVVLQGRIAALDWLAERTGVKVVAIPKAYNRHQCAEHCKEAHTRIESETRRLVLSGARATIVLHNVEPFMRVQGVLARNVVWMGQRIGYKTNVVNEMTALGWTVPDLREQPRARVARLEVAG